MEIIKDFKVNNPNIEMRLRALLTAQQKYDTHRIDSSTDSIRLNHILKAFFRLDRDPELSAIVLELKEAKEMLEMVSFLQSSARISSAIFSS